jgi:hypothetical protein
MPLINADRNRLAMEQLLALLRTGQPYAMTGSGVSVWAGYRTWQQVIERLAAVVRERRGAEVDTAAIIRNHPDLLFCVQHLGQGLSSEEFTQFVQLEFGPNGKPAHNLLYFLAQMPFKNILTLNFDRSMEDVHAALELPCGTVSCCNRAAMSRFVSSIDSQERPRQIVHLHGIYTDPIQTIALTEQSYLSLYHDNHLFRHFLWLLAATKRIVFFGFGFGDFDFLRQMSDAARDVHVNGNRHFAVYPIGQNDDDDRIRQNLNDRYLVQPIFYELVEGGGDAHARFPELINGLSHELALPGRPAVGIPEPVADAAAVANPEDLRRAAELTEQLLGRIDRGGDGV